jgi:5'-nucleotidase
MRSVRLLALVAAAALHAACVFGGPSSTGPSRPTAAEPIRITLVATNDIHGWVYPQRYKLRDGTEATEGGFAAFSGYLNIIRKKNPGGTLLLDGGDLFQGTLAAKITEGAVVIEAMNQVGYTAAAMGNHEFDYGPVGPPPVALKPGEDPFGALKARLKQARFPILAANIIEASNGGRPDWLGNDGTAMVEVKGLKVGIVGLITPSTPNVTNPMNVASVRFGALAPDAQQAARSLRDRGAKVVIAVVHAGGKCASWDDPRDLSSCDQKHGEIFEMLANLPPRTLDAVIAGHTHSPLGHFVNGTPVVETWGLGRYFGMIDLYVDPYRQVVLQDRTRIVPLVPICEQVDEKLLTCESRRLRNQPGVKMVPATFMGEPVVVDEAVSRVIAPVLQQVAELQNRPLGVRVEAPLTRNYEGEGLLGTVLADTLRESEKADVVFLNPGGLRADLQPGELRYGDIYEVIPFDNTVATLTVNGEELRRLLTAAFGARKGVFPISGIKVQLSKCPGEARLKGFTLSSGKPVRPDQKYRVVTSDFLALGGDGLGPVMSSLEPGAVDLGLSREHNLRDSLIASWQAKKAPLVAPTLGRVTYLDDGKECHPAVKVEAHGR